MPPSGMLRRVDLLRTDVSDELRASIIRVTRTGEIGTLAVTSNRRTLRKQTSQKTAFLIVTAVKTSNVT
jgi:beta-lactamase superfamily II metal-dependent hydrolase